VHRVLLCKRLAPVTNVPSHPRLARLVQGRGYVVLPVQSSYDKPYQFNRYHIRLAVLKNSFRAIPLRGMILSIEGSEALGRCSYSFELRTVKKSGLVVQAIIVSLIWLFGRSPRQAWKSSVSLVPGTLTSDVRLHAGRSSETHCIAVEIC
jgi:hypothetical protein